MNKNLFRKASVDRMNSPEQLNAYIRVARPSTWLLLGVIVCLLVGAVIWGVFGVIDTTVSAVVVVSGDGAVCYVGTEKIDSMTAGMPVLVDNEQVGTVSGIPSAPEQLDDSTDPVLLYMGGFSAGDFCYVLPADLTGLDNGMYQAEITVDSVSPASFVIN